MSARSARTGAATDDPATLATRWLNLSPNALQPRRCDGEELDVLAAVGSLEEPLRGLRASRASSVGGASLASAAWVGSPELAPSLNKVVASAEKANHQPAGGENAQ
jgi:hypothetical protein